MSRRAGIVLFALALALAACADPSAVTAPDRPDNARGQNGRQAVLIGAGDIAECESQGDEATAAIIARYPRATVFTAGDNAYPNGSPLDYDECYDPSWGKFEKRTQPAVGNHEYITPNAAGYLYYYGPRVLGPNGLYYYSYDVGPWHVVVLNSMLEYVDPAAALTQRQWLAADLAANPTTCTLAYFHHPRFSSARHGNQPQMQAVWEVLYAGGADVVVSAHDHVYERFAPQTPTGAPDPQGIRQFVAGLGGANRYEFHTVQPNSEVRYDGNADNAWGVLKLTLGATSYAWEFIPTTGSFADGGSGVCH